MRLTVWLVLNVARGRLQTCMPVLIKVGARGLRQTYLRER